MREAGGAVVGGAGEDGVSDDVHARRGAEGAGGLVDADVSLHAVTSLVAAVQAGLDRGEAGRGTDQNSTCEAVSCRPVVRQRLLDGPTVPPQAARILLAHHHRDANRRPPRPDGELRQSSFMRRRHRRGSFSCTSTTRSAARSPRRGVHVRGHSSPPGGRRRWRRSPRPPAAPVLLHTSPGAWPRNGLESFFLDLRRCPSRPRDLLLDARLSASRSTARPAGRPPRSARTTVRADCGMGPPDALSDKVAARRLLDRRGGLEERAAGPRPGAHSPARSRRRHVVGRPQRADRALHFLEERHLALPPPRR